MAAYQTRRLRLTGAVDVAQVRHETFNGRAHTVLPVIALMETVLWPANAPAPEFVPAEVLEKAPQGWNGRAVMLDHPNISGDYVSANSPAVLELFQLGTVFNAKVVDKKLHVEHWLDDEKCMAVDGGPAMLERVNSGTEPIEVSVGAQILLLEEKGNWNGMDYAGKWIDLMPDHIAMLPEGTIGACSVDAGCGALRTARHRVMSDRLSLEDEPVPAPAANPEPAAVTPKETFLQRLASLFRPRLAMKAEDMSHIDLEQAISAVLQSTVPGFSGLMGVWPAENLVVYTTYTSDKGWVDHGQNYKLGEDGTVSMKGEAQPFEPVTKWQPVAAEGQNTNRITINAGGCGCQHSQETAMASKSKAERVQALLASKKTTLPEAFLQGCSEAQLDELEKLPEPTPAPAPAAEPAATPAPAAEAAVQTEEEFLKTAPQSVKDAVASHKKQDATRRAGFLKTLADSKQTVYSEAELNGMSTDTLEKVTKLAGLAKASDPIDYSGAQSRVASESEETVPVARNLNKEIREQGAPAKATK